MPTQVSIERYRSSTRIRELDKKQILGYCIEDPQQVLAQVFLDFHVTSYNNWGLFSGSLVEEKDPLTGLSICEYIPETRKVLGLTRPQVTGRLSEILALRKLQDARRVRELERGEVERIISCSEEILRQYKAAPSPIIPSAKRVARKEEARLSQIPELFRQFL